MAVVYASQAHQYIDIIFLIVSLIINFYDVNTSLLVT